MLAPDREEAGADDGGTTIYASLYGDDSSFVECTFPVAPGQATIPAAALDVMGRGKAYFSFGTQQKATSHVGHFEVQFVVSNNVALTDAQLTLD